MFLLRYYRCLLQIETKRQVCFQPVPLAWCSAAGAGSHAGWASPWSNQQGHSEEWHQPSPSCYPKTFHGSHGLAAAVRGRVCCGPSWAETGASSLSPTAVEALQLGTASALHPGFVSWWCFTYWKVLTKTFCHLRGVLRAVRSVRSSHSQSICSYN